MAENRIMARDRMDAFMRLALSIGLVTLCIISFPCVRAEEPPTIESLISNETRLMVFSPHPDDESLGTAGLIQRVLHAGGKVRIVFMTSGDGYPEGVQIDEHVSHPGAKDFRKYGKEREMEARKALEALGVTKQDIEFLGFPDGGLCYVLSKFRADPKAYTSPFTLEERPPLADRIIPDTDYNDQDLRKEIVRVLADFRPTLIATTPAEDLHPDHCATYHFVIESLKDLHQRDPAIQPRVLSFLIHFGAWPQVQGTDAVALMTPPEDFTDKEALWLSFTLQPDELEAKRKAIGEYRTQMVLLGKFLLRFAAPNELFVLSKPEMQGKPKTRCSCNSRCR